jgi:hypothetical protein
MPRVSWGQTGNAGNEFPTLLPKNKRFRVACNLGNLGPHAQTNMVSVQGSRRWLLGANFCLSVPVPPLDHLCFDGASATVDVFRADHSASKYLKAEFKIPKKVDGGSMSLPNLSFGKLSKQSLRNPF